jgi:hypothetical protein
MIVGKQLQTGTCYALDRIHSIALTSTAKSISFCPYFEHIEFWTRQNHRTVMSISAYSIRPVAFTYIENTEHLSTLRITGFLDFLHRPEFCPQMRRGRPHSVVSLRKN